MTFLNLQHSPKKRSRLDDRPESSSPSQHFASPSFSSSTRRPHLENRSSLSLSDLSAFLLSLHPSITPLAPHLLAAGIDTLDVLSTLPFLDPPQLEAMLDLIRQRSDDDETKPKGSEKLSVTRCRLFARRIREAAAE